MKKILRNFLINLAALWAVTLILPSFTITGGFRGMVIAGLAFMLVNLLLIPLIKILLLPLNLLTLGLFGWLGNVLALYFLVTIIPNISLSSYYFSGFYYSGFMFPAFPLSTFAVAIVASFIIGTIINVINWLIK